MLCLEDEDAESNPSDGVPYMCEECGHEQSSIDWKYRGYKIGRVLEVQEIKNNLKKCKVTLDGENELQIVTNAKHVAENELVVVASQGAIVPAGADPEEDGGQGTVVKQASVGGEKSEAMMCDGVMLSWQGGANGVLVKLLEEDGYMVGARPPATKPRKE